MQKLGKEQTVKYLAIIDFDRATNTGKYGSIGTQRTTKTVSRTPQTEIK